MAQIARNRQMKEKRVQKQGITCMVFHYDKNDSACSLGIIFSNKWYWSLDIHVFEKETNPALSYTQKSVKKKHRDAWVG